MRLNDRIDCDVARFRSFFKVKTARSRKYLDFVARQQCAACGKNGPSDPHHEGKHGMSIKAPDSTALPLCRKCHSWRHQTGPHVYVLWGIDPEQVIARMQAQWLENGNAAFWK